MYSIPILILGFNRPDHISRLIGRLRDLKPIEVYFSFDGPRDDIDKELIQNSISKISSIDWNCKIHINKMTENHGGCFGPAKGITWFFNQVDFGIIFDDDIDPRIEFFEYVERARLLFENDPRIAVISGNNFSNPSFNFWNEKIGITQYFFGWGWATWSDKWKSFKVDWAAVKNLMADNDWLLEIMHGDQMLVDKQKNIYEQWKNGAAWDFLWQFHLWKNGWKTLIPPVNLTGNVGIGDDATNCKIEFPFIAAWKKEWYHPLPQSCYSSATSNPLGDRFMGYVVSYGIPSDKLQIIKNDDNQVIFAVAN